jgi:hypothetical protein
MSVTFSTRSHEVARVSAKNLKLFFGNTAPSSVVNLFERLRPSASYRDNLHAREAKPLSKLAAFADS